MTLPLADGYPDAVERLGETPVLAVDSEDVDKVLTVERVVSSGIVDVGAPVIPNTELSTQVLDEAGAGSSVLWNACEVVMV